ncbi:MAG: hypothetical protein C4332_14625 [Meiothermus sp.]
MARHGVILLLATVFAGVTFWFSFQAGDLRDPLERALQRDTPFFCSGAGVQNPDTGEGTTSAGQAWGIGLLIPLPFVLIGTVGFLLWRSGRKSDFGHNEGRW